MTRTALLRLAVLALPVAGLGGLWLSTDRASRQGTDWDIPVEGYDPRDLLQGHYVQFRYDWPGYPPAGEPSLSYPAALCLTGTSPVVAAVREVSADQPCAHRIVAAARFGYGYADLSQGRLYVPQAEADKLTRQLGDPKLQGVVRIRLRPDGHVTPLRLTFRPRPPGPDPEPPTR